MNVASNAPGSLVNSGTCTCSISHSNFVMFSDTVTVAPMIGSGVALTVTRAGSGIGVVADAGNTINCGAFCTNNYPVGTMVTLTATPVGSAIFTGWQGACIGTGTCAVTLNAPASVSATFAAPGIGIRSSMSISATATTR